LPTEKPGAERRRVFYEILRSSLLQYFIKNPHIAQRCWDSLMPPPVRIGEANPVLPTIRTKNSSIYWDFFNYGVQFGVCKSL